MENEERPRKLQKFGHDDSNEINLVRNGESPSYSALKNSDKYAAAEGHQCTTSALSIEPSQDRSNGNEHQDQQEVTTKEEEGDKNGTAPAAPMSKKQQKRLLKMQKWVLK